MDTPRNHIEIQRTADDSPTLYLPDIDEHYHSTYGAVAESVHVYIQSALLAHPSKKLHVLEIGFGTGLNTFNTLLQLGLDIHYTAFELHPLDSDMAIALGYDKTCTAPADTVITQEERISLWHSLHHAPWGVPAVITPHFTITKLCCDITENTSWQAITPQSVDVVYYDAFAPDKQPEMWKPEIFERIFSIMRSGGILTTYCAKGAVRRMLQDTGFSVERIPGPPGGKREILRATKP